MRKGIMILVTALVCASAFGECPEAEKKTLEELDRAWGEATQRGDRSFLNALYADDYEDLSLTGAATKAEVIDNAVRNAAQAQGTSTQSYDRYMISCTPISAAITHRVVTTPAGRDATYFRSIHLLEKRNGRWVVVSNAGHALTPEDQIRVMEHEWSDADRNRDVAWFEKHFADDYFGISSRTGAMNNKKQDLDEMRATKQSTEYAQASDMNVRVEGDTAVVTGVYHTRGKDEQGKSYDRKTRYTDIYVKRNGSWQVLGSQGTPMTQ